MFILALALPRNPVLYLLLDKTEDGNEAAGSIQIRKLQKKKKKRQNIQTDVHTHCCCYTGVSEIGSARLYLRVLGQLPEKKAVYEDS